MSSSHQVTTGNGFLEVPVLIIIRDYPFEISWLMQSHAHITSNVEEPHWFHGAAIA